MAMTSRKPILCLDFDGVIHSCTSKWREPSYIPDPPVPGTYDFLREALELFHIVIYSSRSISESGLFAMRCYIVEHFGHGIASELEFASKKPAAFLTIDDRAMTFTGTWPNPRELLAFKPWNKK